MNVKTGMAAKIYTLSDPTDNYVFYVGRTTLTLSKRLHSHLSGVVITKALSNFIQHLKNKGIKVSIECVEETNWEDSKFLEEYWIQQFDSWGFNLFNVKHKKNKSYYARPCTTELITEEERWLVDALESRGDSSQIAKMIGVTPEWVRSNLKRKRPNIKVKEAFLKYYQEKGKRLTALIQNRA